MALAMPATANVIGGVEFPIGPISFADEVVNYSKGLGVTPPFDSSVRALGPPGIDYVPVNKDIEDSLLVYRAPGADYSSVHSWESVSLGRGGRLDVRFTDNDLFGSSATTAADGIVDLIIFDASYGAENASISISTDGSNWISVGDLSSQLAGIDIDAYAIQPNTNYNYVRIQDSSTNSFISPWSGVEVNAVGAVTTRAHSVKDLSSYRQSTNIYINPGVECTGGQACNYGQRVLGDSTVSNQFQLNLEYDGDFANNPAIKAFNDKNSPSLNMSNANAYGFDFGVTEGGGSVPVYKLDSVGATPTITRLAHWAITGGNHTLLFGTWFDADVSGGLSNGDFLYLDSLRVQAPYDLGTKALTWKPGFVNTEVLGYVYRIDVTGTYLQALRSGGYNLPVDVYSGSLVGCAYNPNGSYDMLLMILLACGLFYGFSGWQRKRIELIAER